MTPLPLAVGVLLRAPAYPSHRSLAGSLRVSRRARPLRRRLAILGAAVLVLFGLARAATAQDATLVWRGQTYPIPANGPDFRISDAARALGFEVASDAATGVLTLTGHGHKILVGAGTAQVPVDQQLIPISRPAVAAAGAVYAPPDFFEKVLFPAAGASGTWDAARRSWTLSEGSALSVEATVVHVAPVSQVILKLSAGPRFVSTSSPTSLVVRWPGQTLVAPFSERRYEDPLVSAIRFAADSATVEFREPNLSARAYALTAPDRVVVEVVRSGGPPAQAPAAAVPPPAENLPVIVVDPGHGGVETGAIGPGGLQEKKATLEIGQRLAGTLPKTLACRVVLTRDADALVSLDDRTSIANHEKADLFLSIHANSSRVNGAHGSETYYLSLDASDKLSQEVANRENQAPEPSATKPPGTASNPDLDFVLWDLAQSAHLKESSALADAIQNELNQISGTDNRGIKQAPFRVLVGATMPAVLIETAFISNADEEKKLASPEFQQSVADAIAKAVARFFERRRSGAAGTPPPAATPTPAPR